MKKLSLLLGMLALVMAVVFAATPKLQGNQQSVIDGYEFIPGSGGTEDMCKLWEGVCDTAGGIACTVSGASGVLREFDNPSASPRACGADLRKLN